MRENELLRALGEQTAPRPVSWLVVAALILTGSAIMLLVVGSLGPLQRRAAPELEEPVDPALLKSAVSAYERADWAGAERLFRSIQQRFPDNARSQDYLDRIELTRRDAELLARAEEALVAGQPERARQLSERVAPNSGLYAQAEGLTRSAMAQDTPGKSVQSQAEAPAGMDRLAPSVRAALGEALAMYEDAKFVEAVQRAQGLAQAATGEARGELARWARDVTTFATLYHSLPTSDAGLLGALTEVQTAAQLDERLSEGKYARTLRIRAARALVGRASSLGQNGHLIDACGELVRAHALAARSLTFREGGNPVLERRCESEALRRVNQARALERKRVSRPAAHKVQTPAPEAQALFEQARSMSLPGSPAHFAAEQAIGRAP